LAVRFKDRAALNRALFVRCQRATENGRKVVEERLHFKLLFLGNAANARLAASLTTLQTRFVFLNGIKIQRKKLLSVKPSTIILTPPKPGVKFFLEKI
jgi:hypothetical protein